MSIQKLFTIGLIAGTLLLLDGCYMERVLSSHDLEFEEMKNNVESSTEYNGIKHSDRIISYIDQEGKEISLPSIPGQKKISRARVYNDTLYLLLRKSKSEELDIYEAIPVSDIQMLRVKRYLKRTTRTITILGTIAFLFLLSFTG